MHYFSSMANIDDRTKISLFAAVCSLPFIIGGMVWLTSIDAKASQASNDLQGLKPLVVDIRERQIRLEQMAQDIIAREGRRNK